MNRADTETFEMLERDWVNYVSKCESREEIPWQAEGVMAKMQIYCGDLPQGGNHKPDMMPSTVDKFRKIYITCEEDFAARMIFRVPVNLQKYIMLEPIIRRKEKVTQVTVAALCDCTLDQYKKGRTKAKLYWVYHAGINKLGKKAMAIA